MVTTKIIRSARSTRHKLHFNFRGPVGYIDVPNFYKFEMSNPINLLDPLGTTAAALPNPGGNWGPVNPDTGQPSYLPAIPGGWKPVANDKFDPKNPYSRPGKWVPNTPVKGTGGGQPSGSWDPVPSKKYPKGHGDVMDGKGGRKHVDENGNEISGLDAHDYDASGRCPYYYSEDADGNWYEAIPAAVYDAQVAARAAAAAAAARAAWNAKPWYSRLWNWRSSPDAPAPSPSVGIPGVNPLLGGSDGVPVPETGPIGIPVIE